MEDEDDDYEEHIRRQREYGWRRKCQMYQEVEELWQKYLRKLDYPATDFVGYVARNYDPPTDLVGARYLVWVWKFVRGYVPWHTN